METIQKGSHKMLLKVLIVVLVSLALAPVSHAMPWTEPVDPPIVHTTASADQILAQLEPEPISCVSASDWATLGISSEFDGYVWFDQPRIYVRDYVCEDLVRVAQGTLPVDLTTAQDAKLIAHEHAHVMGVVDEGQAECAGVHGAPAILEKLGVSAATAVSLTAQIVPFYLLPSDC